MLSCTSFMHQEVNFANLVCLRLSPFIDTKKSDKLCKMTSSAYVEKKEKIHLFVICLLAYVMFLTSVMRFYQISCWLWYDIVRVIMICFVKSISGSKHISRTNLGCCQITEITTLSWVVSVPNILLSIIVDHQNHHAVWNRWLEYFY